MPAVPQPAAHSSAHVQDHRAAAATALPLLRFDRAELHRLELSLSREWLETDGRGGYASSTVLGCATRRYHGLLVAVPDGSAKRHVFLSRFEERVFGHGKSYLLSLARHPGTWVPEGDLGLESFELVPWPRWSFRIGLARFTREVMQVRGSRTVLVRWCNTGEREGISLALRPLLAFREADALTFENFELDGRVERTPRGQRMRPYAALPPLDMSFARRGAGADENVRFEVDPTWYRKLEYVADIARGYAGHEDQFCPGWYESKFQSGAQIVCAASIEERELDPLALWDAESARRLDEVVQVENRVARRVARLLEARAQAERPETSEELSARIERERVQRFVTEADAPQDATSADALERLARLAMELDLAAPAYTYRDARGRAGVTAGYPWFGEWGRDTFIALPGLTLARGDVDGALALLRGALPYLKDGLLPNIFGTSTADSHYGSADAALWFALAVLRTDRAAPQRAVAREFLPALRSIVDAYRRGTSLGLFVDGDSLLHAGTRELNATWMDARASDGPVTPRAGCAVEMCALWCQLLEYVARTSGDAQIAALSQRADASFRARFWIEELRYLGDTWDEGRLDTSVRPNQVIAAALPHSPLTIAERRDVVRRSELELLTTRGLRTLAPKNPAYVGRYLGGPDERDRAYHQGTVWPWLFGFHVEATVRAFPGDDERCSRLAGLLAEFLPHLVGQGLGHVSEVFDGDPPHRPGGAIAQAWSVAELLRASCMLEGRLDLEELA
jgi:glycogen debranching enzyme